jgi:signal transduction histidine kinase
LLTWVAVLFSEGLSIKADAWYLFLTAMLCFALGFVLALPTRPRPPMLLSGGALLSVGAGIAVWLGGWGMAPALYVIIGSQLYGKIPRTTFWLLFTFLNLLLLVRLAQSANLVGAMAALAAYVGFQMFGVLMAANAVEQIASNDALRAVNAHLLATRALLDESAREQERLRLSRELHDVAGHKLTALKLNLRNASTDGSLPAAQTKLCSDLADELLGDIRAVVAQLRVHDGVDLRSALQRLADSWPQPSVRVDVAADARVTSVAQAQALLRIAQEALTNAARHAKASLINISLQRENAALLLQIKDDGVGKLPLREGHGLTGIRERVTAIGGSLMLAANQPSGITLLVRLQD